MNEQSRFFGGETSHMRIESDARLAVMSDTAIVDHL